MIMIMVMLIANIMITMIVIIMAMDTSFRCVVYATALHSGPRVNISLPECPPPPRPDLLPSAAPEVLEGDEPSAKDAEPKCQ